MTPEDRLAQITKARAEYDALQANADRARLRLMTQIGKALAEGAALPPEQKRRLGPSAIARAADFTREYISQIRDGKTGPRTP
jgi:hypothetical protein